VIQYNLLENKTTKKEVCGKPWVVLRAQQANKNKHKQTKTKWICR
jgi:hypothetical protein